MTPPRENEQTRARPPRWMLALKLAVTAALLAALAAAADVGAVARLLASVSPVWFAAAVAVLIAQTLVLGIRFQVVVSALGRPIGRRNAIELSFVGVLFNQALPSAIGGDAARAWRLRAQGRAWREAAAAVIVDRLTGIVVLALLCTAGVLLAPSAAVAAYRAPVLAACAAVLLGAAAIVASGSLAFLPAKLRARLAATGVPAAAGALLAGRPAPAAGALSVASHLLAALAAYALAVGLGLRPQPLAFAVAMLCTSFATMIPLSYAGWGIREAGAVLMLRGVGLDAETALALSVLLGASLVAAALPGLWPWLAPLRSNDLSAIAPSSTRPT